MDKKHEFILVCLILVIAIVMLPVSFAVLTHGSDPYRIVAGDPIEAAAEKAGLAVCSETENTWNIPGAAGGRVYIISDNCDEPSETVRIETQAFDSADSRDAAIKAFHTNIIGKTGTHGNMIVFGQYLIFTDSSGGSILGKIVEKLDEY
ncbi:MAG: hypothetical protein JW931_01910 [Methanomicrobiaceae archaeon]|nr:hypothetical protein [Methanomicrobiaceae archaeon]